MITVLYYRIVGFCAMADVWKKYTLIYALWNS